MAKYFKDVNSLEELKEQFKKLVKVNHPDAGGDAEIMKEINCEYDALFPIWKNRHNTEQPQNQTTETANSTRSQFYTEFGWAGKNHNWNRSLKEVAQIVRAYVKEKYPTYKFSVRTSYASMCQELHVELKESPIEIYKLFNELNDKDKTDLIRKMLRNNVFKLECWSEEELKREFERVWNENGNYYRCLNEATQAVIDDVDSFVKSYNYSDCDGMQDYFHVDFYYFGCAQNNGMNIKVVPKTDRIKNKEAKPAKTADNTSNTENAPEIANKPRYTFKIAKDEDTRDLSELWVVRIEETLSKDEYISINKAIKAIGGYYSKFKHGFVLRYDPSAKLAEIS